MSTETNPLKGLPSAEERCRQYERRIAELEAERSWLNRLFVAKTPEQIDALEHELNERYRAMPRRHHD